MKKKRTPIPDDVVAEVLFQQDHTCCVCRERGKPVQIHHIDENPSNSIIPNLAVLCLEHHEDTQIRGGFGRKLLAPEVTRYRNDWVERVKSRRQRADDIAALRMATMPLPPASTLAEAEALMILGDEALSAYVQGLPDALAKAYARAQPLWDTGVTTETMQGTYDVIEVVEQMWMHLATWFPDKHFGDKPVREYFSEFLSSRFQWHRALAEPEGTGTGGTIVGVLAAISVLADAKKAVEETVRALLADRQGFSFNRWLSEWERAAEN